MAWLLQGLVHGEPPGAYSWVKEDHLPAEDEVIVQSDPAGYVWDTTTKTLRPRTGTEEIDLAAAMLQTAKIKKRTELVAAADAAYKREIPSFVGVVIAAKFVPPGNTQYLTPRELVVFDKIQAGYQKLNTLLDQVNAATTIEEVQVITW